MNAQDWKLSITGENCPEWCTANHAAEDPEWDSIIHESAPITVPLPPMVSGERLRLAFTTTICEDYHSEGHRTQVEFSTETEVGAPQRDCVPLPSVEDLDSFIRDLRQAADAVEQWRDRLPARAA
ncbi:DUF6907 domain-containing protein [Streptomyces noursei]|uniref:DUF6907 domain-containing protein n=1 Tax=Streptomyces noursei TaxID=1971 RepID=UPI003818A457